MYNFLFKIYLSYLVLSYLQSLEFEGNEKWFIESKGEIEKKFLLSLYQIINIGKVSYLLSKK